MQHIIFLWQTNTSVYFMLLCHITWSEKFPINGLCLSLWCAKQALFFMWCQATAKGRLFDRELCCNVPNKTPCCKSRHVTYINYGCVKIFRVLMVKCKTAVPSLLTHWRSCSLALSHQFVQCTPRTMHTACDMMWFVLICCDLVQVDFAQCQWRNCGIWVNLSYKSLRTDNKIGTILALQ